MRERIKKRIKFISIIVFIIFVATSLLVVAHFAGYEESIKVEKDSYVYDYYPDNNFGTNEYLRVGNYQFGKVQTFYYFNISSLPDGWTEVKIIVNFDYGSDMVDVGANFTYESWDEMTITWNNKPNMSVYRGHISCDGFNFNIPLRPDQIINDGIGVFLYGRGGEDDGYIQGNSREGASSNNDIAWIELRYVGIDPSMISAALMALGIFAIIFCIIMGAIVVSFSVNRKHRKKIIPPFRAVNNNALGANWFNNNRYKPREVVTLEKVINEYITIKLANGRSFIYVKGRRFIQCIRLILNIPKYDIPRYDEIDSIDEAAKLYTTHIHQNRIIGGRMGVFGPNQRVNITPEQEFWGHCSNIQAWVEHNYDTRILMSNISFPLLRELTKAGDPQAKKVYKEEIALRLESGYPSVVQYLLTQGYIQAFSPEEFKTILEATDLIKNISSNPRILSQFLISCVSKFPTLLEDILLQILKLPDCKNIIYLSINTDPRMSFLQQMTYRRLDIQYLYPLKTALESLFLRVDEKTGEHIIDYIQIINTKLEEQSKRIPNVSDSRYLETLMNKLLHNVPFDELNEDRNLIFRQRIREQIRRRQSRCSYCGKVIPKELDICEWCGHKKDDDEGGFFPYPYIFKPPGGGGGSMKEPILASVIPRAQT